MVRALEGALFGFLVLSNLSLGLYFSFRKRDNAMDRSAARSEVFLASRMLKTLPLAASSVASLFSSTGLVGFPAHFYAYGWHLLWAYLMTLVMIPLATHVFVPVLYNLRITSIFEYIRMRFNGHISLTACCVYIFLTVHLLIFYCEDFRHDRRLRVVMQQTVGAVSIFAASLTLVTALNAPLFWCNVIIGITGTLYTALGGLRGVVWTDCMQFFFILVAPTTVVLKIIIDSFRPESMVQPFTSLDWQRYMGNYSMDLTSDETIWACLFGTIGLAAYRSCMDQVVTQRLLACRTIENARRTAVLSALLLLLLYMTGFALGAAMTIWFRGCDPGLQGKIASVDQILPYYVNTYLVHVPGFLGLFLAGIAAILFVDVIAHHYKNAERHVLWITRGTAFILGISMTIYSTLCAHMGSVSMVFIMVYNGVASAFVGLCLLAMLFPFVHSKGAGVATLSTIVYQILHVIRMIASGRKPPRMDASLNFCPGNQSILVVKLNASEATPEATEESFILFRVSYMWTSFFAILATVIIGILVSFLTGETRNLDTPLHLCNDGAVRLWRYARLLDREGKKVLNRKSTTPMEVMHGGIIEGDNLLAAKDETCI